MITLRLFLIVMAVIFFVLDGVRAPLSVNCTSLGLACLAPLPDR